MTGAQTAETIEALKWKLKKEQQKCIQLFYIEKKSYADTCKQTGYSFKEVKSYIQNGKRNLRNILDGLTQKDI